MGTFIPISLLGKPVPTIAPVVNLFGSQIPASVPQNVIPLKPSMLDPSAPNGYNQAALPLPSPNTLIPSSATGINGVLLSSLNTGILKNTTGTGIPSIAVASDFPTLNQNTLGNAATATLATTATTTLALSGGATNQIPFQTSVGITAFIPAPADLSTFLKWDGTSFQWAAGVNDYTITGTVNQVNVSNTLGMVVLSLPQDIGVTSAPTFIGTNLSAIPNSALLKSSLTIGTTAIALGGVTTVLADLDLITATNFVGNFEGNATTATSANAIAGGGSKQLLFQTSAGVTAFIPAPTVPATYLEYNNGSFVWSAIPQAPKATTVNGSINQIDASTVAGTVTLSLDPNISGLSSVTTNVIISPTLQLADGGITTIDFTTTTTVPNQIIDSVNTGAVRIIKYMGHITSGTAYQALDILILHDGTSVWIEENSNIFTESSLVTYDAKIVASSLNLVFTPINTLVTIKLIRTTVSI